MEQHRKKDRFLRLQQIIGPGGPIPVSRATWYRGVDSGIFPAKVKIGGISFWRESEIDAIVQLGHANGNSKAEGFGNDNDLPNAGD